MVHILGILPIAEPRLATPTSASIHQPVRGFPRSVGIFVLPAANGLYFVGARDACRSGLGTVVDRAAAAFLGRRDRCVRISRGDRRARGYFPFTWKLHCARPGPRTHGNHRRDISPCSDSRRHGLRNTSVSRHCALAQDCGSIGVSDIDPLAKEGRRTPTISALRHGGWLLVEKLLRWCINPRLRYARLLGMLGAKVGPGAYASTKSSFSISSTASEILRWPASHRTGLPTWILPAR